jgi:hypothetical protein
MTPKTNDPKQADTRSRAVEAPSTVGLERMAGKDDAPDSRTAEIAITRNGKPTGAGSAAKNVVGWTRTWRMRSSMVPPPNR